MQLRIGTNYYVTILNVGPCLIDSGGNIYESCSVLWYEGHKG